VLALTRQAVPPQPRDPRQLDAIRRGGYVLLGSAGAPECLLIATGSEVSIAMDAARELIARGRRVRVVSMPCTSVFDAQDEDWRASVLPASAVRRIAIEAGTPDAWWRYVGSRGRVIGMTRFGASAPGKDALRHFGFTSAAVVEAAESLLNSGDY
jgi:transketolase